MKNSPKVKRVEGEHDENEIPLWEVGKQGEKFPFIPRNCRFLKGGGGVGGGWLLLGTPVALPVILVHFRPCTSPVVPVYCFCAITECSSCFRCKMTKLT